MPEVSSLQGTTQKTWNFSNTWSKNLKIYHCMSVTVIHISKWIFLSMLLINLSQLSCYLLVFLCNRYIFTTRFQRLYSNLTKHLPCYFKIKGKYFLKICFIIVQHILQTSAIRNKTYTEIPSSFLFSIILPIPLNLQVSSGQFQQSLYIQSVSIWRHVYLFYKWSAWVERTAYMSTMW